MRYNTASPRVEVDPRTYAVAIDGQVVEIPPAERLPLTFLHFIA
jgi:urease subunit alpha